MSKELAKTYDPKQIEEKMYEKWCENKYFHAEVDLSLIHILRLQAEQENPRIQGCGDSISAAGQ